MPLSETGQVITVHPDMHAGLRGALRAASDKSLSHRALMFAALAQGNSRITHLLTGEDVRCTATVLSQLGVNISIRDDVAHVEGVGLKGLQQASEPLDFGNSGTSVRLMSGILCGQSFSSELTGDESLITRPMNRIIKPLTAMGARITASESGCLPMHISSVDRLQGIDYESPVASAQVKSCVLLAGLYAEGRTRFSEPVLTRDYTESMLLRMGYPLLREDNWIIVNGPAPLEPIEFSVPADPSAAAFFMLAATVLEGSDVTLTAVGMNPTRTGFIRILQQMGADIRIEPVKTSDNEPVSNLHVRSARLRGIDITPQMVPDAIDEFPALFVAAACAAGTTRISGAAELRVKESDRIHVMAKALSQMGIDIVETEDGAVIQGGSLKNADVDSGGDHRCAMSLLIAGLRSEGGVSVMRCDNIATSYPEFLDHLRAVGVAV